MSFIGKSETLAWVSGGKKTLPLDFQDRVGPRTGRLALEKIVIRARLNITTVAANTIPGVDFARFMKKLRIYDSAGNRVYLQGDELRVFMHAELGDVVFPDPATHVASTTQDDVYFFTVNFSQIRSAKRRYDFAFPIDDLQNGGGIEIEMPTNGDLFQTGAGATINNGDYTLYFYNREEWDVEFKSRDVRESQIANSLVYYYSVGNGRALRALYAYVPAQGGGTVDTTVQNVTIESYKLTSIPRDVMHQLFLQRGIPVLTAQDPFFNNKALPLLWPNPDAKQTDSLIIPGQLAIRMDLSTFGPPNLLSHYIAPKDERMMKAAAESNGIDGSQIRVKTAGKTAGDPAKWGNFAAFMPVKSPRPQ